MKIHILYNFVDGAYGGGNQFLKALRQQFRQMGCYAESIEEADVILFNSHHILKQVWEARRKYPEKHFIHRIGSAFALARGDSMLDRVIYHVNQSIADGTIFQSKWSKDVSHSQGMRMQPNNFETNILNAPDTMIFHPGVYEKEPSEKIRIITTGWSQNTQKGVDIYKYLDENLDFTKYRFMFFGRAKRFRNIDQFPPQESRVIGWVLRSSDLFITATAHDTCSNSLIEALHCGLPAVARNSGGHPEIVKGAGILFEGKEDVIEAIEKVSANLDYYKSKIDLPTIKEVGKQYFEFCWLVKNLTTPKKYNRRDNIKYNIMAKVQRAGEIVRGLGTVSVPALKSRGMG